MSGDIKKKTYYDIVYTDKFDLSFNHTADKWSNPGQPGAYVSVSLDKFLLHIGRSVDGGLSSGDNLDNIILKYNGTTKDTAIASDALGNCPNLTVRAWVNGKVHNLCLRKGISFNGINTTAFSYSVNADGETITITKRRGTSAKLVIPETIDGYTVTAIAKEAFMRDAYLTSVTLPATVKVIGARAFQETGLASIVIPQSVTTIDYSAFQSCASLTTVTFDGEPTTIFADSFKGCSNLTVYGIAGSAVEAFANNNGFAFVAK